MFDDMIDYRKASIDRIDSILKKIPLKFQIKKVYISLKNVDNNLINATISYGIHVSMGDTCLF